MSSSALQCSDLLMRLLNTPTIALVVAFSLAPIIYVFYLSFQDLRIGMGASGFAGFDNCRFVLQHASVIRAFTNTLYFAVLSVLLATLVGLGIALLPGLDGSSRRWCCPGQSPRSSTR
jgi:ABC-type sugar transport system permease subunit